MPAYTEAGRFAEAYCLTVTDGERYALYAPHSIIEGERLEHVLSDEAEAEKASSADLPSIADAWAAMALIHEAVGELVPPGTLASQKAINAKYGPTFAGCAEAIVAALMKLK